jgi:hypothetical protein
MKLVSQFTAKFSSLIQWVFSSFDRVIFKGHLPITWVEQFQRFVDYDVKKGRYEFLKDIAPKWSQRLVDHAKNFARKHNRLYAYHPGHVDKDAWAKERLRQKPVEKGLVGILCVMEVCSTFKLKYGDSRPCFTPARILQRVLYYYFVDKDLGLIHVRLQTCAPFTCQVYANGHDYVARQLKKKGIAYEQVDNAFVALSDPASAQRCADRFSKLPWPKILEQYAQRVNPLLQTVLKRMNEQMTHYWVIDQAEYATDIRFKDKAVLALLFFRLLDYAFLTFSPRKIFSYLGRRWHERYDGEVQTHYKSERIPGSCIKHYMRKNWLKMYDKLGLMLRVETVINQPGDFKVLRECHHRDGSKSTGWFPMRKGVGNMHHYQSHALACNQRYLEALSAVANPAPAYNALKRLTERERKNGRSYAGFNPAREEETRLFAALLTGDHVARGFRNQDIRTALYGNSPCAPQRRKQSAAVGRVLKRLQVRGLVVKVPRTRRWQVTEEGRHIMGDTLYTYRRYKTKAA